MSSLPTPPRLGLRVPLPRAPREGGEANDELQAGDVLEGRYQIEDRLGEGGVGLVYRARQIKLHRRVAIKLLQSDVIGDEELKPRFEREALTLAALSHPNIVSLTDYGAVRGRPYLVMELLEGRTLREVLDLEGALEPARALGLTRQVLLALAYAHELGIVHRDLKPSNLLMQVLPSHEHVKVLDFGLVKFTPGSYLDSGVQLSRVGFTFGTPAYMSPEHAVGGEVDGRSDLYSVGVLVFELLSGQKPFDGELQDILRAHFQAPVPKLAERRPALAGRADLQAFVERAMAKEREDRFPDAAAMIAAIDALLSPARSGLDATMRLALASRPRRVDSLRAGAARASGVAREGTRVALVALRTRGGPLLLRAGQGLGRVTKRSVAFMWRASREGYAWLRPKAAATAKRLLEHARHARSQLRERARERSEEPALLSAAFLDSHAEPPASTADDGAKPVDAELVEQAETLSSEAVSPLPLDPDATIVDDGTLAERVAHSDPERKSPAPADDDT